MATTEYSDEVDYDEAIEQMRAYNQPILDDFEGWLDDSGLAGKTIKNHVQNIDFFTEYLGTYDPPCKLDEADYGNVISFLTEWFPRKAMWASVSSSKSNMGSFRKFYKFMAEKGHIESYVETEVRETLKEHRDEILEAVELDDDYDYEW